MKLPYTVTGIEADQGCDMTTEREIQDAKKAYDNIEAPDFKKGRRLRGVSEMPADRFRQAPPIDRETYASLDAKLRKIKRPRNWPVIIIGTVISLIVLAYASLAGVCQVYTPPKYAHWEVKQGFGPWQDMGETEECQRNFVEMIKRGEWDRLRKL